MTMIMRTDKMIQAENMRYMKIQRLIDLLCSKDNLIADDLDTSFSVGKRITINGETITIKNKTYSYYELQKVTINTEGSLAIYDRSGKRLCNWIGLNLSVKNIELFCLWVIKYKVPAEVISGKAEKTLQFLLLAVVIIICILFKIIR